jgi:uncharacterized membrane protein SpoIIM required for sporulation
MIGYAELRPGLLRRRDSVIRASRRAVELVLAGMPVFVAAGIIEGNFSPSSAPLAVKLAVGPALWVLLMLFLLLVGRRRTSTLGAG